jgi:hypothetical protein
MGLLLRRSRIRGTSTAPRQPRLWASCRLAISGGTTYVTCDGLCSARGAVCDKTHYADSGRTGGKLYVGPSGTRYIGACDAEFIPPIAGYGFDYCACLTP